jgi:hypothetical protein
MQKCTHAPEGGVRKGLMMNMRRYAGLGLRALLFVCIVATALVAWGIQPAAQAHGNAQRAKPAQHSNSSGREYAQSDCSSVAPTSWGGYHGCLGNFMWAYAQITVPTINSTVCNNDYDLAAWVGVGSGASNNDRLVQAGVQICGPGAPFAFIEDYAADDGPSPPSYHYPQNIASFGTDILPGTLQQETGDIIRIYVSSNYDLAGKPYFSLKNVTKNLSWAGSPTSWPMVNPNGNGGSRADWEIESFAALKFPTSWSSLNFTNTSAYSGGNTYNVSQTAPVCDAFGYTDKGVLAYPGPISADGSSFSIYPAGQGINGCTGGGGGGGGTVDLGSPAVGSSPDGRLWVVKRVPGGQLWHDFQVAPNAGWSGWGPISPNSGYQDSPAMAQDADGRLEIFMRGADGAIWHAWQQGVNGGTGWLGFTWVSQGYAFASAPAVGRSPDGRLWLVARATNGDLWHNFQVAPNGTWSGWGPISSGVAFTGTPVMGRNADGRLEVFARASDTNIWHLWQQAPNGGTGWVGLIPVSSGSQVQGSPAVMSSPDGRLWLVGRTANGQVWHDFQVAPNAGWSGWGTISPTLSYTDSPVLGQNADGRLEVFERYSDGSIYHGWQQAVNGGAGWLGFVPVASGTGFLGNPAVGRNADGRLEVFAHKTDGVLWHTYQVAPNSGWTIWSTV